MFAAVLYQFHSFFLSSLPRASFFLPRPACGQLYDWKNVRSRLRRPTFSISRLDSCPPRFHDTLFLSVSILYCTSLGRVPASLIPTDAYGFPTPNRVTAIKVIRAHFKVRLEKGSFPSYLRIPRRRFGRRLSRLRTLDTEQE